MGVKWNLLAGVYIKLTEKAGVQASTLEYVAEEV
jgi:hypothetical protein